LKISIIIPAFNEERLLGDTLKHINASADRFRQRGWDWELIVCDNNSTDRTAEIARSAGAKVVFEPVNQIGRARNAGAAAAIGEWLIFVDADSHPTAELFADVINQIESGSCLAGGSTVRLEGDYPAAKRITSLWNFISRNLRWMAGSFIFCETKAFREVGGFSSELFATEELDLSKRLKKLAAQRGKKIVILQGHPMLTSARKLHLYTVREHLGVILRMVIAPGKALRNRQTCRTWYDGRR
jgi:glycosyltransferase involved in cell wall biosynthesis